MTLKEKIEDVSIKKGMSDKIEQIADNYAIEFAKWYDIKYFIYNTFEDSKSTKELLEIFKKEKGL